MLKDKVGRLACTKAGSFYFQKELSKADTAYVEFILKDIGASLSSIMIDRYGNYFC
jgi:hypothetical protein